jgi:ornithine carrier protein
MGLYRGISAPLSGAAFETSSLFFFESLGREAVYSSGWCARAENLPLMALWFSGAFSGAFTSFVLTPIELVKCRIQMEISAVVLGMARLEVPTIKSVTRQVYKQDGILGFWRGQMGTFLREVSGSAAWFGAKETTTELFYLWREREMSSQKEKNMTRTEPLSLWQQAVAGASGGISYSFVSFPADTIKSRIQTSSMQGLRQKKLFWKEAITLWHVHGVRGFYRGCGITVLRSALTSALIFVIHDGLKQHLQLS